MIRVIADATIYGITNGAAYLLIALGITLLFGSMRIFFYTHGSLYMAAALLLSYFAFDAQVNLWVAIPAVVIIICLFSLPISTAVYSRVGHSAESGFIAFLALSIILQSLAVVVFGVIPRKAPAIVEGSVSAFGFSMQTERALLVPAAAVFVALLFLFLYRTKVGKALRAIVQNSEAAALVGINPTRVNITVFMVAFFLVAVAGVIVAPTVYIEPTMGDAPLLKAFVIVILGGLGSIPGAILASVVIGVIESVVSTLAGANLALVAIFVLILMVLIARPRGLFGTGEL